MTVTKPRNATAWTYLAGVDPRLHAWVPHLRSFFDDTLAESVGQSALETTFSEYATDEDFSQLLVAAWSETVDCLRRFMCGLALDDIALALPATLAATQARLDISERRVESSYRLACRDIRERWMLFVDQRCKTDEFEHVDALAAVAAFIRKLDDFHDYLIAVASKTHANEREAMEESGQSVRQRVLREILAGSDPLDDAEVAGLLNHPVSGAHVVFIVSGCSADTSRRRIGAMGSSLGASHTIVLPLGEESHALWVTRASWSNAEIDLVLSQFQDCDATVAIAGPEAGAEGFRAAYHQAQQVEAVRAALGGQAEPVIRFEDVQLEVMAMRNQQAARRLVERELGELAGMTPTAEKLRETLCVWFALGSHVSTAASLGLHEHTVRNRVRRVEAILGHPLYDRRTEVQVALRLHRLLPLDAAAIGDAKAVERPVAA